MEEAETGTEPIVVLTLAAREKVKEIVAREGRTGVGLRLGVKGGGCSGLSYHVAFDTEREGDHVIEHDGFRVFLDRKSTIYLRGIQVDHQGGLSGKGFVFKNPNASNTCGCGESFSV